MFDCVILGDSIAVGVATAFASMGVSCDVRAGVGWPTHRIAHLAITSAHQVAIVSAGSNDTPGERLARQLQLLRRKINANCVIWIYPYTGDRAWQVQNVAVSYGDSAVSFKRIGSNDGVHPRSYSILARTVSRFTDCPGRTAPLMAVTWRQANSPRKGLKGEFVAKERMQVDALYPIRDRRD